MGKRSCPSFEAALQPLSHHVSQEIEHAWSGDRTPNDCVPSGCSSSTTLPRIKYRKATLVFKCVNQITPMYMTNLFTPLTHIRETRQSTRMGLTIPFAKKNCYATSFAVSGAIIWNDLPPQLLTIACLTSFKLELCKTLCFHYVAG